MKLGVWSVLVRKQVATATPTSDDHAEVSVFAFSVKGNSATVQAAVLGIARSMGFGGSVLAAPAPPRTPVSPALAGQEPQPEDGPPLDASGGESAPIRPNEPSTAPASRPSRKRIFPMPKIVDALNAESPNDGFKSFVGTRKFGSTIDRTLVAAFWMKEKRNHEEFDANDLFTCFKMVNWSCPPDTASLLRALLKISCATRTGKDGRYKLTSAALPRYEDLIASK